MDTRAFEFPSLEAPAGLEPYPGPAAPAPRVDLAAEVDAARAAGHQEGLQIGLAEAQQHIAPAIEALQAAAAGLAAERERIADAVEAAAVQLGLKIAEQALAAAVATDPAVVVDVVRGALRRIVERERVTILVNPEDLDLVRSASERLAAELGGIEHCDVQAERRVGRGGAVVRTVDGEVDASLATKLARAREVLETELRRA